MSSVPALTDLKKISDSNEFMRFASSAIQAITDTVNGRLEFGPNIKAQIVSFTAPSSANSDFPIKHTLGKSSVYYLLISQSAAFNVYNGATPNKNDTLYLKANVASASGTLLIF